MDLGTEDLFDWDWDEILESNKVGSRDEGIDDELFWSGEKTDWGWNSWVVGTGDMLGEGEVIEDMWDDELEGMS